MSLMKLLKYWHISKDELSIENGCLGPIWALNRFRSVYNVIRSTYQMLQIFTLDQTVDAICATISWHSKSYNRGPRIRNVDERSRLKAKASYKVKENAQGGLQHVKNNIVSAELLFFIWLRSC